MIEAAPDRACFFCDGFNTHEVFLVQAPGGLLVETHPACAAKNWDCGIRYLTPGERTQSEQDLNAAWQARRLADIEKGNEL